jgi:hypothetical protein
MDYYYTEDGVYLGQDDKKSQNVYSVKNDSYSGQEGKFVVMEDGMTQIMDNKGNAMTHDQFRYFWFFDDPRGIGLRHREVKRKFLIKSVNVYSEILLKFTFSISASSV